MPMPAPIRGRRELRDVSEKLFPREQCQSRYIRWRDSNSSAGARERRANSAAVRPISAAEWPICGNEGSAARINSLWLCLPSRGLRGGFRQFDADLPAPSTGLAARERVFGPRGLTRRFPWGYYRRFPNYPRNKLRRSNSGSHPLPVIAS